MSDQNSGNIFQITPAGVKTTFATGLDSPVFLAFAPVAAAVPEPGSIALLVGLTATGAGFVFRRRKQTRKAARSL